MAENAGKGLVDSNVVSKLFNVTPRQVTQLVTEGVITATKDKGNYKYDLPLVTQQYIKHLSDRLAGRESKSTTMEQEREKLDADIRMKKAKAAMLELQFAELEGKMHKSEDVEALTTDLVFAIRGMLIALPGRLAIDTVGAKTAAEASNLIRAETYKILEALTNYRYDPDAYAKRVRERQGWSELVEDETDEP